MALSDKVRNDWISQLKRSRAARVGGKKRRQQEGSGITIVTKKVVPKEQK
jgi:hypothetical protein